MKLKKTLLSLALAPVIIGANVGYAKAYSCSNDPFCAMHAKMDRMFDSFGISSQLPLKVYYQNYDSYPKMDLINNDDNMIVKVDIPGIDKDNIEIDLHETHLTVSGKRESNKEEESENYRLSERSYGEFKRSLRLPVKADIENAKTSYKDGVLEISIPKIEPEKPKSRKLTL